MSVGLHAPTSASVQKWRAADRYRRDETRLDALHEALTRLHCDACGEELCAGEIIEFLALAPEPHWSVTRVRDEARRGHGWAHLLCGSCAAASRTPRAC